MERFVLFLALLSGAGMVYLIIVHALETNRSTVRLREQALRNLRDNHPDHASRIDANASKLCALEFRLAQELNSRVRDHATISSLRAQIRAIDPNRPDRMIQPEKDNG